jgi:hypothetical protein
MRPLPARSLLVACLLASTATAAGAQVIRLEITSREPMNNGQAVEAAAAFELIRGKVHGEIDPKDPHNTIIQDLDLAPMNAGGKVEYVATFALARPVDPSKGARVLLYQVVNRGNGQAVASPDGYVSLVSGWQGDVIPAANNQTIVVPIGATGTAPRSPVASSRASTTSPTGRTRRPSVSRRSEPRSRIHR